MSQMLSVCCEARVYVDDSDKDMMVYRCAKCKKICDRVTLSRKRQRRLK